MCLIVWTKEESFEREQMQKYKDRRPQTTILGRLVFIFIKREKPPPQYNEMDPGRDARPVRKRPDSLTLAKYASMRKHAKGRASKVSTAGK
jgi:hypothetical protein